MTGRAVDDWVRALQVLDVFQIVVIDRASHLDHLASDLLGGLVILLPLIHDMAVCAIHAE